MSDLHIGLPQFKSLLFEQFLTHLPDESQLVLNGDTIDDPTRRLSEESHRILDLLSHHSERLRIIWVEGNHDEGFVLPDPRAIEFTKFHVIPECSLYISHGMDFDNVMPKNRWFIKLFRFLHRLRVMLGAAPVHVAEYAKKWRWFYTYLRNNIATNAIEHARENGWEHVVCGHVHFAEERRVNGVTYYNTGTWTEAPPRYLYVTDDGIELLEYHGGEPQK